MEVMGTFLPRPPISGINFLRNAVALPSHTLWNKSIRVAQSCICSISDPSADTAQEISPLLAFGGFFVPIIEKDNHGNFVLKAPPGAVDTSGAPIVKKQQVLGKDVNGKSSQKTKDVSKDLGNKKNASSSKVGTIVKEKPTKDVSKDLGIKQNASSSKVGTILKEKPGKYGPQEGKNDEKKLPTPAPKYSKAARRFYNEKFREPERLSKILAAAGVASRRASEEIIFEGRVTVNGKVCNLPQTPVDPLKDTIYVDGHSLPRKLAPKLYFALNKPKGYICTSAEDGTKSVLTLLDSFFKTWAQQNPGMSRPRLFTVGRLDVATSGLILITNDGEFGHKVSHPSSGVTKEYIATVDEKVSKRQLQAIIGGTKIDGVLCIPKEVELLTGETTQRLRIVVSDGRKHEVRLLVENAGLEVQGLKRVRIGGLRLSPKLSIGKYQQLNDIQAKKILEG